MDDAAHLGRELARAGHALTCGELYAEDAAPEAASVRNCGCIEPCYLQLNVVICLIVSLHPMSNRATPSGNGKICLTQIARQIWEPWYHYVIGPCETVFP